MSSVQVFISYAHEDTESAQRLYKDLKNAGLNPWLDKESLLPGHKWDSEIREAIRKSRYFVPILSSNSIKNKGYVRTELRAALDILGEVQKSDVYVIPIRIDEIEVDDKKLRGLHIVDLFPDWNHGVEAVLKSIKSGAAALSAPTKRGLRAAQEGLGISAILLSCVLLIAAAFTLKFTHASLYDIFGADIRSYAISITLLIIGIERIISGIFSSGKGRKAILYLGILVVIASIITALIPVTYHYTGDAATTNQPTPVFYLASIALSADGIARVYFGIANRTTSRRSRIFSIVVGVIEIMLSILVVLPRYGPNGMLSIFTFVVPIIVGTQMVAAGISGRRLTIAQ